MKESKVAGRNGLIDFLKGSAIFAVLWGHSIQYLSYGGCDFFKNKIFILIYSFHMPLFMFLSGYVFFWSCRKRDLKSIVLTRIRAIGIPMITWGTISFVWNLKSNLSHNALTMLKLWAEEVFGIWFLWSVLLLSLLLACIYKLCVQKKIFVKYCLLLLATPVLILFPGRNNHLFMYPYFLLGFFFNEKGIFEKNAYKRLRAIFIIGWFVMLPFYEKKHYIYTSGVLPFDSGYGMAEQIKIDLFRYTIGFFGLIAVIEFCKYCYNRIARTTLSKMVEQAGRLSLDVYVLQGLFLEKVIARIFDKSVRIVGYNYLMGNQILFDFGFSLFCVIACLLFLTWTARKIEKNAYLRYIMFGKL